MLGIDKLGRGGKGEKGGAAWGQEGQEGQRGGGRGGVSILPCCGAQMWGTFSPGGLK